TTAFPGGTTASLTSITPHVSPAPGSISDTCSSPTVNGNTATCTVTINSEIGRASRREREEVWDVTGGTNSTDVSQTTDETHGSSGPAVKRFVDAKMSIAQDGVNEVGHQHVLAISTTALPGGTTASLTSITPHVSPAPGSISDTCSSPTVNGNTATCTVTINS